MIYTIQEPQKLPKELENSPLSPTLGQNYFNNIIGEIVGKGALVGQTIDYRQYKINDASILDDAELKHTQHQIITYDQASLEFMEIQNESQMKLEPKYRKYVIHCNCNYKVYQQIVPELQEMARELDANVIGWNYRNVNCDKDPKDDKNGKYVSSFKLLMIDTIAQVQRLLDEGASIENITLSGLSIGGGIATSAAGQGRSKTEACSPWEP